MQPIAKERYTAEEALKHPWISATPQNINIGPRVASNLDIHFSAQSKFNAGLKALQFINKIRRVGALKVLKLNPDADKDTAPKMSDTENVKV